MAGSEVSGKLGHAVNVADFQKCRSFGGCAAEACMCSMYTCMHA